MSTNQSYQDISALRSRTSRRVAAYDNDDEQESEASEVEVPERDFESGPVLYQDSKEQSSVSSADVTPSQYRSDNNGQFHGMPMPIADSTLQEMTDDQKNIFNKLDASNAGVDAALRYLQESIAEEKRIKDLANSANQGLFNLKFQQMKEEEELIRNGTHPDYLSQMQEIEDKRSFYLQACTDGYKHRENNILKVYDSQVKFADETFLERKKIIKKQMLALTFSAHFQKAENNKYSKTSAPFSESASVLGKRKLQMFDQLCLGPGYTKDIPMPDWIRHILKLRRRAGLDPVPIPFPCFGLDDAEIEEDLSFISLVTQGQSQQNESLS